MNNSKKSFIVFPRNTNWKIRSTFKFGPGGSAEGMAQGGQADENGRTEEPEDGIGNSRLAAVHVKHVCITLCPSSC